MLSPAPEIHSFTAGDGTNCSYRRWQAHEPRGHVVVLHGIISHSGWYLKTGAHLARAGLTVHSLDRRGSGLNLDRRGDVDRYETWIDDVLGHLEELPRSSPVVLLGISWGGLLATAVARRHPDRIAGLGLLCPGFFSRKGTSEVQHQTVRAATRLGMAGRRFPVPLQSPHLFTRSEQWQRYIRDDPFTLRRVTLRLATASADLYANVIRSPAAVTMPTLLMLAGDDLLIRNDQVHEFVNRYFGEPLKVKEYPHAAHTLEFEQDPTEYLRDLSSWCQAVTETKSA